MPDQQKSISVCVWPSVTKIPGKKRYSHSQQYKTLLSPSWLFCCQHQLPPLLSAKIANLKHWCNHAPSALDFQPSSWCPLQTASSLHLQRRLVTAIRRHHCSVPLSGFAQRRRQANWQLGIGGQHGAVQYGVFSRGWNQKESPLCNSYITTFCIGINQSACSTTVLGSVS